MHRGEARLAGTNHDDVELVGLGELGDGLGLHQKARDGEVALGVGGLLGGDGVGERHGARGDAGGGDGARALEDVAAGCGGLVRHGRSILSLGLPYALRSAAALSPPMQGASLTCRAQRCTAAARQASTMRWYLAKPGINPDKGAGRKLCGDFQGTTPHAAAGACDAWAHRNGVPRVGVLVQCRLSVNPKSPISGRLPRRSPPTANLRATHRAPRGCGRRASRRYGACGPCSVPGAMTQVAHDLLGSFALGKLAQNLLLARREAMVAASTSPQRGENAGFCGAPPRSSGCPWRGP